LQKQTDNSYAFFAVLNATFERRELRKSAAVFLKHLLRLDKKQAGMGWTQVLDFTRKPHLSEAARTKQKGFIW